MSSTFAVSTAQILARKALEYNCGQECVDWAIHLLETGHDGDYIARLAGMLPPHNPFEIAEMRDRVLCEIEQADLPPSEAVTRYAVELLESFLSDELQLEIALSTIAGLYLANAFQRDIQDFYLLHHAYQDLQKEDIQYYWPDATRKNIVGIVRDCAERFVALLGGRTP